MTRSDNAASNRVFLGLALLTIVLIWGGLPSEAKDIDLLLRINPELELEGSEHLYIGPILVEPREGHASEGLDVIASREFERYLRRLLRRETRLYLAEPITDLELPTRNPVELLETTPFWQDIGRETESDFIVTGAVDVEVLDRAGYQTEEYVSPQDGKTYFRQVLVEETGFKYDILITVLSGETGEVVFTEQISDFQERPERKLEVYKEMFNDLYTLESRLLGIFVPRFIRAKRYLFN